MGPEGIPRSAGVGESLARLAVRKPVTVCMLFLLLSTMGVVAVDRVPLMLMPTLSSPVMTVVADYHNATPAQVLESITKPIEDAIATVPGVRRMSSISTPTGTRIRVWCGRAADTSMIRANLKDRIDQFRHDLPDDLRQVEIRKFSTDEIPILEGLLTAELDLGTDYEFLDTRIKRRLERLPGVGDVDVWGASPKQLDILLRVDDVKRHGVDVGQLYRTLEASNIDLSLGRLSDGANRYTVTAKGTLSSVNEIAHYPIGQRGLVLSDVADVVLHPRPQASGRHHNGTYAVGISIHKTSDANTVEVVDRVKGAFAEWAEEPATRGLAPLWEHDSGDEIRKGIGELLKAGLAGAVLSVLVLYLFLRRLVTSLTIALAIPFCVLTAVGFLYFSGGTLNVLSMMGLMLAAGMLVDNAIVVLESILQKLERGTSPAEAARRGAGEVTVAVIAATSTTIIIFVPLLFDSDSQITQYLGHVGVAIISALTASLFVSLTLIPMVAAWFLNRTYPSEPSGLGGRAVKVRFLPLLRSVPRLGRRPLPKRDRSLVQWYLCLVEWHADRRYLVGLIGVPAVLALSTWLLLAFVPDNSPDANVLTSLRVEYEFSENYNHAKIERDFVNPVERFLHANLEGFKLRSTSSSYGDGSAWTRVYLDTERVRPDEIEGIRKAINAGLPRIPGARIELGREGSGERNRITANLYGDDPEVLRELTLMARKELLATDGISEVYADLSGGREELRVQLRREVAKRHGVSPRTVSQVLGITVRSKRMRSFRSEDGEVELWVGVDPAAMQSVEDLESLVVGEGNTGEPVLLGHVAMLSVEPSASQVARENRQAFVEIEALYLGERMDDGLAAVSRVFDSLPYEQGYNWSYGFVTSQQSEDMRDFLFSMALALVMVYFVMAALFESVLHPFAIMVSLPFSTVGVVAFLLVTDTPFNLMAQVGIILLIGIVVNNGIVLVNHINNLRRQGVDRLQAVRRGCQERLRPICMTAATTIIGLAPLAWGGASIMGTNYFPLARTVMGGLTASTVLTLLVLPTYYLILDDFGQWVRRIWVSSEPA